MYDLLLSKSGISAPAAHPLRVAVTGHKARLSAELTKIRIKKGCKSIDELRAQVRDDEGGQGASQWSEAPSASQKAEHWPHPRWVRINTLRSTLAQQLQTTFVDYKKASSLEEILLAHSDAKIFYIDEHISDLVALPPGTNLSTTAAYHSGLVILQDKASCFPACLLDPKPQGGPCLDACAAPGNKTSHLAATLRSRCQDLHKARVWACERDASRARILSQMVSLAGCQDIVTVKVGQDFLLLNPDKPPWKDVGSLLLDPSCSGSGIVGRDEMPTITLPDRKVEVNDLVKSRKRKRSSKTRAKPDSVAVEGKERASLQPDNNGDQLANRLEALSAFQLRLLLHAFRFPKAQRISYSTCSIYAEENETVIIAALQSIQAKRNGWRLLRRDEQVDGMKSWHIRGDVHACYKVSPDDSITAAAIAEACIRCKAGTEEGTQGFFVAAFVREPVDRNTDGPTSSHQQDGLSDDSRTNKDEVSYAEPEASEQWEGFNDTD